MTMINREAQLPLPGADKALWDGTMQAGFEAYPERLANWTRYKAAKRSERPDYLPVKMDIENVSRCNYHCTMCQVSDWPKYTRARDMELAEFIRLLDEQTGLVEIKLQGMGEPLLAAEPFFAMVREARRRHLWVRSTTNGSLLHIKDNYRHLIDSDICEVQVSIDGASAETYEAIRRGGKFDRLKENCKLLNGYAREVGKHRTRMWAVVQKTNFDELEAFPALAEELGFARLTLSLDLNDWGQDRWREVNDQVDMQRAFGVERARALVEDGRKRGVEVTFWFIDEKYDRHDHAKLCAWPFERLYIGSDMRVVPCCMIANPDIFQLGDATELTKVWNSDVMAGFRRAHLTGDIPDVCRFCYKSG